MKKCRSFGVLLQPGEDERCSCAEAEMEEKIRASLLWRSDSLDPKPEHVKPSVKLQACIAES